MFSFRRLFSKNLSYNFYFCLGAFKWPLVNQKFCRDFLLTEIFLRGNAISYMAEKHGAYICYSLSYFYFCFARIKSMFHRNSKNWNMVRNAWF